MTNSQLSIPIADIILDNDIYPRSSIDHKRVGMFAENIRDGFEFEPIHVQELSEEKGKYRILDGAHRWQAHKSVGAKDVTAKVIKLNGRDPLLYAAQKAIGPRQLTEEEGRETARRAYQKNPRLSSAEIGKAIGLLTFWFPAIILFLMSRALRKKMTAMTTLDLFHSTFSYLEKMQ